MQQQSLFEPILQAYAENEGPTTNNQLYKTLADKKNVSLDSCVEIIGTKNPKPYNTFTRSARWAQQSLRKKGMIERVGHGQWCLTKEGKHQLARINSDRYLVAANTELGLLVWGNSANVFDKIITEDVHLVLTSPPYLGIQRSYGTFNEEQAYSDMIISVLEPLRKRMVPGANLVLNLSNDSVLKKRFGERSLYLEELTIRIARELDLHLMDRMIWDKLNPAPGPTQYVSKQRTHLNSKYEPILVFNSDPQFNLADNRRVLQPYSESMKKLIESGGEARTRNLADSDHRIKKGSFAKDNGGSVLSNVLRISTTCANKRQLAKRIKEMGLPPHSATFPVKLADTLIRYFCPEGGRVVDPFGGWSTVGYAAEQAGYKWATCDMNWEYVRSSIERFNDSNGLRINPEFIKLDDEEIRFHFASQMSH
jgi:DNA modification methylase